MTSTPGDPRDPSWHELTSQAQLQAWEAGVKALVKAVQAIQAGKVTLGVPASRVATCVSSDGQRTYTVTKDSCTCRATRPCYHQAAAELYRLWQDKLALRRPEGRDE